MKAVCTIDKAGILHLPSPLHEAPIFQREQAFSLLEEEDALIIQKACDAAPLSFFPCPYHPPGYFVLGSDVLRAKGFSCNRTHKIILEISRDRIVLPLPAGMSRYQLTFLRAANQFFCFVFPLTLRSRFGILPGMSLHLSCQDGAVRIAPAIHGNSRMDAVGRVFIPWQVIMELDLNKQDCFFAMKQEDAVIIKRRPAPVPRRREKHPEKGICFK